MVTKVELTKSVCVNLSGSPRGMSELGPKGKEEHSRPI